MRCLAAFPAGSNGEFNLPENLTTVIRRGEGYRVWTAEGREMLDFSMGWGSVLVGHSDPRIIEPVTKRLHEGTNFACVTDASLQLAEELIAISPACEQMRFCASGTEATMYCLRLARAATGKQAVLRFEGAYHGAHDVGVTSLFPSGQGEFPCAEPSCDGLVAHEEGRVLTAPFNDPAMAVRLIEQHAKELAAVIVEPLQRCLPPEPGFLEGLRDATRSHRVLLIFDEVVTGFRLALGGAQQYYRVSPDLVAYGKALGGGFPIGAFGGPESLMRLVSESRLGAQPYVWTASTLGGNPISSTAALATIGVLREEGVYQRLHRMGNQLRDGMRDALADVGVESRVLGDGPLAQVAFTDQSPRDYRSSAHKDKPFARSFMLNLFRGGVWLNPMGTKLYLSLAHTDEACERMLEAFRKALLETVDQRATASLVAGA